MGSSVHVPSAPESDLVQVARLVAEALGISLIIYLLYGRFGQRSSGAGAGAGAGADADDVDARKAGPKHGQKEDPFFDTLADDEQPANYLEEPMYVPESFTALSSSPLAMEQQMEQRHEQQMLIASRRNKRSMEELVEEAETNLPILHDSDQEEQDVVIGQLQEEVLSLRDQLEQTDLSFEQLKLNLVKETSRSELLRQELKIQEDLWKIRLSQLAEVAKEHQVDLERCQKEAMLQRETFRKTLETSRSSLSAAESELREKEQTNQTLRKDLLDLMSRFTREKTALDERLRDQRRVADAMRASLTTKGEAVDALEQELLRTKRRLERKSKEKRSLIKATEEMRQELRQLYKHNERGLRMSKMLEQIDSID